MKELRTLIKDLREDHDLKQKDVASYLSISQQTYSNYESGHREIPTWVVAALAKYYNVSSDYLLGTVVGYPGNMNLHKTYLDDITLLDVMLDIQKLKREDRQNLLKYLGYLLQSETTK
ncbi:MAG: helix-turn-helix domain-containing protein [Lachnospiraceae bacterium]|nr:helix-turn-helix domain-containing protein [Lachnospiraceae bacterium]